MADTGDEISAQINVGTSDQVIITQLQNKIQNRKLKHFTILGKDLQLWNYLIEWMNIHKDFPDSIMRSRKIRLTGFSKKI